MSGHNQPAKKLDCATVEVTITVEGTAYAPRLSSRMAFRLDHDMDTYLAGRRIATMIDHVLCQAWLIVLREAAVSSAVEKEDN